MLLLKNKLKDENIKKERFNLFFKEKLFKHIKNSDINFARGYFNLWCCPPPSEYFLKGMDKDKLKELKKRNWEKIHNMMIKNTPKLFKIKNSFKVCGHRVYIMTHEQYCNKIFKFEKETKIKSSMCSEERDWYKRKTNIFYLFCPTISIEGYNFYKDDLRQNFKNQRDNLNSSLRRRGSFITSTQAQTQTEPSETIDLNFSHVW